MRILFLSSWFPCPPTNGSKLRIHNLLRSLAEAGHEVTLLSFSEEPEVDRHCAETRNVCRAIEVVPRRPFNPRSGRAWLGFLSSTPRSIVDTYSGEMVSLLKRTLRTKPQDVIVASQLGTAAYAPYFGATPALFEEIELGVLHDPVANSRSAAERLRHRLTWMKHCRYLTRLLPYFRAGTVVSARERELMKIAAPSYDAVEVVPNFVSLHDYDSVHPGVIPGQIVFAGSLSFHANLDAIEWFLAEVYPLVRARLPEARVVITGDSERQRLPTEDNVVRTGMVEDVRPWIASSCLSIVPTRIGGGTRIKILESMALGAPVVATSKGAEGLETRADEHLLLANDAASFADAVVRLSSDPELRARLSRSGRRLVEERYDSGRVGPRFRDLVERVAEQAGR